MTDNKNNMEEDKAVLTFIDEQGKPFNCSVQDVVDDPDAFFDSRGYLLRFAWFSLGEKTFSGTLACAFYTLCIRATFFAMNAINFVSHFPLLSLLGLVAFFSLLSERC